MRRCPCLALGLLLSALFFFPLSAKEPKPADMTNLETMPTSIVDGCVNVISGALCLSETDLELPGPTPQSLQRFYCSDDPNYSNLGLAWNFPLHAFVSINEQEDDGKKYPCAMVMSGNTPEMVLFCKSKAKPVHRVYVPSSEQTQKGVVNNSSGQISARTNIRNFRVEKGQRGLVLASGSNKRAYYYFSHTADGTDHYLLDGIVQPNKTVIKCVTKAIDDKFQDHVYRLKAIQTLDHRGKLFTAFNYHFYKPGIMVDASDGRQVSYDFDKKLGLLTQATNKWGDTIKYSYVKRDWKGEAKWHVISRRDTGDNRFMEIDYYNHGVPEQAGSATFVFKYEDPQVRRVKCIKAPIGCDATPLIKYTFIYDVELEKVKKDKILSNGHTIVYNAVGQRTDYTYDRDHRLNLVEYKYANGMPMARQRLFWGGFISDNCQSFLTTRTFENEHNWIQFCKYYVYDSDGHGGSKGNVLQEYLYGNLSGGDEVPVVLLANGIPDDKCESYVKNYAYCGTAFHRPVSESDGTITTLMNYVPDSDLISSKVKKAGDQIIERQLFTYDDDYLLVGVTIDDGNSMDSTSRSGVTEWREKRYIPRINTPRGLPTAEIEYYLDFATGEKRLNGKKLWTHNLFGHVTKEEVYDSDNQLAYTLHKNYDIKGNVTHEIDAIGRSTVREFDSHNNCIFEQSRSDVYKRMTYDCMNRLTRVEEVHNDGVRFITTHRYNLLGDRIATVDPYGNETQYCYDEFSRLTQTISPTVLNQDGLPYNTSTSTLYDSFGRAAYETDPLGGVTQYAYTIRGQVCYAHYPDGTTEIKRYSLNGYLIYSQTREGNTITYTNDALGRILKEEAHAPDGSLLYTRSATYNTFHKLSDTDPTGITTLYEYYGNGTLKAEQCGTKRTEYVYDSLNRVYQQIERVGDDAVVKVFLYDVLNRVIEERLEDGTGTVQKKVQYAYDEGGNKCQTTTYTDAGVAIESIRYNSRNQAVEITDAAGNKKVILYRYDFYNDYGINVPYHETIDENGIIKAEQYDALGRLEKTETRNSIGEVLQRQQFRYNAVSKMVFRQDDILVPQEEPSVVIKWNYDTYGRLTDFIDAYGTPEQRHTHYIYNELSQLAETIKPDGVSLYRTYDAMGRLASLSSSDDTIKYTYTYDASDRLLESKDLLTGAATTRRYDLNGRLAEETLTNGYTLRFAYDQAGRPMKFLLPDGSAVAYSYKGALLRDVARLGTDGTLKYHHSYDTHDLTGRIITETLIGQAGTRSTTIDIKGRTTAITTPHWNLHGAHYDPIGTMQGKTISDPLGTVASTYTYDDLYQLTSETGNAQHTYVNDSRYNRRAKDGDTYTVNALNSLLSDSKTSYTYDQAGRMTAGGSATYTYDALDRLVTYTNHGKTTRYAYDAQGRRVAKDTDLFLYQGDHEVARINSKGTLLEFRALGIGLAADISASISVELCGKAYAPIYDTHGNLTCLLSADTGLPFETYRYSSFEQENDKHASPWRFSSKRVDEESGLVYYGKRYYAPWIGRWVTTDPLGYEGGPNLYTFVNNSPLIHYDAMGLYTESTIAYSERDYYEQKYNNSVEWFDGGTLAKCVSMPSKIVGGLTHWLGQNLIPVPGVKDVIKIAGLCISGDIVCGYTPDWMQPSQVIHIEGSNPSPDGTCGVSHNGICTSLGEAVQRAINYSERLGGLSTDAIYNAGYGLVADTACAAFQWCGGKLPAEKVSDEYYASKAANAEKSTRLYAIAHSQGCMTLAGSARTNPEFFSQHVIGGFFAGPRIGDNDHFNKMKAYVAPCDAVCWFGVGDYIRESHKNPGSVQVLESQGCPLFTHSFEQPCYSQAFGDFLNNYKQAH